MKKLLALIMVLIMAISLAACGNDDAENDEGKKKEKEETVEEKETDGESEEAEETETEYVPEVIEPEGEKYESDTLQIYGESDKAKDIFVKYVDAYGKNFLTTDGRVLPIDDLNTRWWYDDIENKTEEFQIGRFPSCKDEKGFIYIFEGGTTYPVSNLKGEILFYFSGMLDGKLYVFTTDANKLYVTTFDSAGLKGDYDAQPVYLYDYMTKTYYDEFDSITVLDASNKALYATCGDVVLKGNVSGLDKFDGKTQIWITAEKIKASDVVAVDSTSLLYKKDGINTSLFYGAQEFEMKLPDGKTIDQLTKVVYANTVVLLFDDGSVYTGERVFTIVGIDFVKNEELSKLNAEGAIVEIYKPDNASEVKYLMDDNVTYVAVIPSTEE